MIRVFEEFPEMVITKYAAHSRGYTLLKESWEGREGGGSILDPIVNYDGARKLSINTPLREKM